MRACVLSSPSGNEHLELIMHFTLDQVLTLEKIRERERESGGVGFFATVFDSLLQHFSTFLPHLLQTLYAT